LARGETRAYLHSWNVVGHVLGIRDELLVHDLEEAARLFDAIKRQRAADTPDGRALTTAVIGVCERFAGPSRILLRPIPRILMRGLLQGESCAMLGVPTLGLWHTAYRPFLRVWSRVFHRTASDTYQDLPDIARLSA